MKRFLAYFVLFAAIGTANAAEKDPAQALRSFYNWYVRMLVNGTNPLDDKEHMRQFVTERLLAEVGQRRKPDPFLNTSQVDPDWTQNIAVGDWYVGRTMSKVQVILTGKKFGDRQIDLKLLMQNGAWKIDEIRFVE
jgi:Protein of unknown function (DUF3828)